MLEMIAVVVLRVCFQVQMCLQLRETPPVQLMDVNHMLSWSDMMAPRKGADLRRIVTFPLNFSTNVKML